jgi:hypothetical protein
VKSPPWVVMRFCSPSFRAASGSVRWNRRLHTADNREPADRSQNLAPVPGSQPQQYTAPTERQRNELLVMAPMSCSATPFKTCSARAGGSITTVLICNLVGEQHDSTHLLGGPIFGVPGGRAAAAAGDQHEILPVVLR